MRVFSSQRKEILPESADNQVITNKLKENWVNSELLSVFFRCHLTFVNAVSGKTDYCENLIKIDKKSDLNVFTCLESLLSHISPNFEMSIKHIFCNSNSDLFLSDHAIAFCRLFHRMQILEKIPL